jgi:septum formation protein
MINSNIEIFLASKSPRRRKLLKQLGLKFKSFSVDVKEEIFDGEHPIRTVKRLALSKADAAGKKNVSGIVITADTIVVLNGEIIGKPKNKKDAEKTLSKLSGKTHSVYTGFVVNNISKKKKNIDHVRTDVTFRKISVKEIKDYVATGSPMDKAGAYGIQDDFGAVFVKKIDGCYYNVVGLPLERLYRSLLKVL